MQLVTRFILEFGTSNISDNSNLIKLFFWLFFMLKLQCAFNKISVSSFWNSTIFNNWKMHFYITNGFLCFLHFLHMKVAHIESFISKLLLRGFFIAISCSCFVIANIKNNSFQMSMQCYCFLFIFKILFILFSINICTKNYNINYTTYRL